MLPDYLLLLAFAKSNANVTPTGAMLSKFEAALAANYQKHAIAEAKKIDPKAPQDLVDYLIVLAELLPGGSPSLKASKAGKLFKAAMPRLPFSQAAVAALGGSGVVGLVGASTRNRRPTSARKGGRGGRKRPR